MFVCSRCDGRAGRVRGARCARRAGRGRGAAHSAPAPRTPPAPRRPGAATPARARRRPPLQPAPSGEAISHSVSPRPCGRVIVYSLATVLAGRRQRGLRAAGSRGRRRANPTPTTSPPMVTHRRGLRAPRPNRECRERSRNFSDFPRSIW